MSIVVDASIAVAWILPDEHNHSADEVLDGLRGDYAIVPSLFWFETRNLFLMAERRGRLGRGEALLSMAQLRGLPLRDEGMALDNLVFSLAERHRLSAYDATYLALSFELALPLATADLRLASAAKTENLSVLGLPED